MVAIPAVYRLSRSRFKRNLTFLSAIGTSCLVHFPVGITASEATLAPAVSIHFYIHPWLYATLNPLVIRKKVGTKKSFFRKILFALPLLPHRTGFYVIHMREEVKKGTFKAFTARKAFSSSDFTHILLEKN